MALNSLSPRQIKDLSAAREGREVALDLLVLDPPLLRGDGSRTALGEAVLALWTDAETLPEIDPRAALLVRSLPNTPMGGRLQLLFCFQGLGLPKGMLLTRGLTRTEAAKRINEFFGAKAVTRASKPPRPASGAGALEQYLSWAIGELERRNPGLELVVEEAVPAV